MSWEDIIKVSRYEKEVADEFAPEEMAEFNHFEHSKKVFEMFKPQLMERGEHKITPAKAKNIMKKYEELGNLSKDKRKEYAVLLALGRAY